MRLRAVYRHSGGRCATSRAGGRARRRRLATTQLPSVTGYRFTPERTHTALIRCAHGRTLSSLRDTDKQFVGAARDRSGILSFLGDLGKSGGELDTPINQGGTAGTDYSQLMITSGKAFLEGLLNVTVANPDQISHGDILIVLTADSGLSGFFTNAPPHSNGMSRLITADRTGFFTVLYLGSANGPSAVELTGFIEGVPEPPSLTLLLCGLSGLLGYGAWQRRRVA
jgi:hypothetical protein